MSRSYSQRDIKLLWGKAAARCSMCKERCISESDNANEKDALIGDIAHILDYSDSSTSSRSDSSLSKQEKNSYDNLILLCSNCHKKVDQQKETYSQNTLIKFKNDHEAWVVQQCENAIADIGFNELEIISKALVSNPSDFSGDFSVIPPKEKLNKNNLSEKISQKVSIGLVKSKEVENFLSNYEGFDPNFSSRLVKGFVDKYLELKNSNITGDTLFDELHVFSSINSEKFKYQAAGLAILVYLFEKCEVFEH